MSTINLAIIGAQKAGTTSLKNYLAEHPEVRSHPQLEFSFFRDPNLTESDFPAYFQKCFTLGDKDAEIKLAKNVGICNSDFAIKRLYEHNPECKLIYVLREPVSRLVSAYNFEKFNGWLNHSLEDVIPVIEENDKNHVLYKHFLEHGLYSQHIERILKYFPREQLKIVFFERLKSQPLGILKDICKWVAIDSSVQFRTEKVHNQSKTSRSRRLGKMILFLRTNEKLKRPFRKILPYKVFTRISNFSRNSGKAI
ncbi:MAG: sulfotransferase [Bacteroidota bacterium]